jgi:TPP-dependent pyruvate/acetoin dehydrogenase alpha subunit
VTTETEADLGRGGLTADQLLEMYRFLLLTREMDSRIRTLYLQGKVIGGVYSQLGHEAISVGTAYALDSVDVIAPMHRDMGAHLVRGMEPQLILAQIMARAAGYTGGKDNALHIGELAHRVLPQISMLGASIPLAAGAALAARQRGENRVALTYVGDGGINTGDFHEGLNFAAALRLPLVLIVENNQFAFSTPVSKQIAFEEIAQRAVGYGIPGRRIDGNDVMLVYETAHQAVERARRGEGPTLIECVTMRMRGHSEHDDAAYVPRQLIEEWSARDPIVRFESRLLSNGIMSSQSRDQIAAEVAQQVEAAAEWAVQQPMPAGASAFEGAYSMPVFGWREEGRQDHG